MLVTLQDLKSNIFLIVSCECPHRLSDKLLKSIAAFLYKNQPFGRCCEEAYITFSSVRVKQFFAFSFQNLSLPFQCSSRFALSCSRSVDAHYRESEKSGNPFFAFFYSTAALHSKTPTYTDLYTKLSTT